MPWRRKWQPIPVFLPGESHKQRNLVGYSPQGHKESGTTEWLNHHHHQCINHFCHMRHLAWQIPWAEEPGRLQSMGSLGVGHDWATLLSLFTCMHWRRKWQPTPVFLPGESQGRRSLVGCRLWGRTVHGVARSRTWLKPLSSSSSSRHQAFE